MTPLAATLAALKVHVPKRPMLLDFDHVNRGEPTKEYALALEQTIQLAVAAARRQAIEECAQMADMLAAELEADALTCKANPLSIVYPAHEVLNLQQRQVSEAVVRIRSLSPPQHEPEAEESKP